MSDLTIDAISAALRGLSMRQRVIAQNLANSETPSYRAGVVSFEEQLRNAIASGNPNSMTPTVSTSSAAANIDGNNVALDDETVALVETGLRYQLMTQAASKKFEILRASIGRGF